MAFILTFQRILTLLACVVGLAHILFSSLSYYTYVQQDVKTLGRTFVDTYLAFVIIGAFFFFAISSPIYMWSYRYYEPDKAALHKRTIGISINLLFSDVPLFFLDVDLCWKVNLKTIIQSFALILTCISFAYSILSLWIFLLDFVGHFKSPSSMQSSLIAHQPSHTPPTSPSSLPPSHYVPFSGPFDATSRYTPHSPNIGMVTHTHTRQLVVL
eukprot:NODE_4599_length_765_cov_16.915361_g4440_i0.p1 GENE.NODE_4599_length_765_cov_16.915361_g4440_i0~~NODE_4599_length_765_cov_16.915361_g4440_i0.p1  ORF type:complete len:235 (+),score=56.82 NODE_4599_length_765_cov_16.915361_g4440_i0:67-705(+)